MGKAFTQVTMEERCEIARLRSQGSSVRQIAAGVDRPPSTVARELKRNGSRTLGYQPRYANQQAHARRWRGSRLERDGPLREQVLAGLGAGWSPAQVAGRLALDEGRQIISPESIYRFIYAQMARKKDYSWRHYLPRAKAKRGFRGRRGGSPATHITLRVPLSQRPHAAADRATFGHWEGDLMHFGNHGPALLALAERHSRLVLLARLPGKQADVTADTIARLLAPLPPAWRQTITFDNGTEFARHYRLHPLGIQTFFCDTRSPWQKGGVENAIGRLRRPLPRKTRLADLSEAAFTQIIQLYNNTPRKCLGYRTPAETLDDQVLHLECELTESRAGGAVRGRLRPPSYRRAPSSFPPSPARVIPAKAGIQRGEARGVSHSIAPPLPTEGAPPKSVRPEPVEACPEVTRRGPPTTNSPRITPSPPPPREPHPLCAGRPTDTALLPPLQCLGYRLPMAVTISHRNQNTTDPHASGRPSPVVGGMVRIDGQRWLVKYQEGLSSLCKKILDL